MEPGNVRFFSVKTLIFMVITILGLGISLANVQSSAWRTPQQSTGDASDWLAVGG